MPVDLFHRLDALANDALDVIEELVTQTSRARFFAQRVVGLVQLTMAQGVDVVAVGGGVGFDLIGVGARFRLDPRRLSVALGGDDVGEPAAIGDRLLPCGRRLFLGFYCLGARFLGQNALLGDVSLLTEARRLDAFARADLRFLSLAFALGLLLGEFGSLGGSPDFHLALLFQARVFALAVDLEHPALRFEILGADLDDRALLDFVAHAAAHFDDLGHPCQSFGVEGV